MFLPVLTQSFLCHGLTEREPKTNFTRIILISSLSVIIILKSNSHTSVKII
jgi:hypothetical protein